MNHAIRPLWILLSLFLGWCLYSQDAAKEIPVDESFKEVYFPCKNGGPHTIFWRMASATDMKKTVDELFRGRHGAKARDKANIMESFSKLDWEHNDLLVVALPWQMTSGDQPVNTSLHGVKLLQTTADAAVIKVTVVVIPSNLGGRKSLNLLIPKGIKSFTLDVEIVPKAPGEGVPSNLNRHGIPKHPCCEQPVCCATEGCCDMTPGLPEGEACKSKDCPKLKAMLAELEKSKKKQGKK